MKETRNILGWLGVAGQHAIMADAEKHVEETGKTVAFLAEAVRAMVKGDVSAKMVAIENVRQSERTADRIRAHMVDQLSEGLLLPPDREDLMRFAKALDKIADWTNSSARLMWFIEVPPPGNVMQHISVSTELILGGVAALREGIRAMARNDIKAALAHCEDVERLEHEADDQKRHLIGAILHAKLDPAPLLLCYNLAESLEGITDKIATAADMIKLLAVKST